MKSLGRYKQTDIKLTPGGDFEVVDGDFVLISGVEATTQNAYCRLRSANPEWFMEVIGADLEDLLGLDNTPETAALGEEKIRTALAGDDLISVEDLYVRGVPLDRRTILFFVFFNAPGSGSAIGFEVTLNLATGAVIRRAENGGNA